MSTNFYNISRQVIAAAQKKPGHSDVMYLCPTAWITTWAEPLNDGTPGSKKRILGNHTFAAGKGPIQVILKPKSVDPTGDAQGEVGGQVPTYKYKSIIKGDSATIQEFVEDILNEDIVAWYNDPTCGVDAFTQVGGECTAAQISGWAFRGGSKGNGGFKEYEFTIECNDKFFYEGALPSYTDPEVQIPDLIGLGVQDLGTTTVTLRAAYYTQPYEFDIEVQVSGSVSFPVGSSTTNYTISSPDIDVPVTGLLSGVLYYARARGVKAGYASTPWVTTVFQMD